MFDLRSMLRSMHLRLTTTEIYLCEFVSTDCWRRYSESAVIHRLLMRFKALHFHDQRAFYPYALASDLCLVQFPSMQSNRPLPKSVHIPLNYPGK